jgi:hypothetical protein
LQILENTGYTSIADIGRFWKILVIPVLQIMEDFLQSVNNEIDDDDKIMCDTEISYDEIIEALVNMSKNK